MHFMYSHINGNASAAQCFYADKVPNRRVPSPKLFKNFH